MTVFCLLGTDVKSAGKTMKGAGDTGNGQRASQKCAKGCRISSARLATNNAYATPDAGCASK